MNAIKQLLKQLAMGVAMIVSLPAALFTGFGRIPVLFETCAHAFAFIPGVIGSYLRVAFYRMTLDSCSPRSRISFGTFFAHSAASIASDVYIGSYCILGRCRIGERTQIASLVQILSGKRQHARDEQGNITGSEEGVFTTITIGDNCWIGASAIIMADVGAGSTIGAGAVVTRAIPPNVIAVGNPARVIRELGGNS
jgi:virginiamycin A acetyltransferase